VIEWLTDAAKRLESVDQLAALKEVVGHGGASSQAACYILRELDQAALPRVLRTHFQFGQQSLQSSREAA
jgi:hypothetical protein